MNNRKVLLLLVGLVGLCSCDDSRDETYGWRAVDAPRLDVKTGLVVGSNVQGKIPAKLSIVCSKTAALHTVVIAKLPTWGNLKLPSHNDGVALYVGALKPNKTLPDNYTNIPMSTTQKGKVAVSISDPVSSTDIEKLIQRLQSNSGGAIHIFGIRDSMLYLTQEASGDDLRKLSQQCPPAHQ